MPMERKKAVSKGFKEKYGTFWNWEKWGGGNCQRLFYSNVFIIYTRDLPVCKEFDKGYLCTRECVIVYYIIINF